MKAAIHPLYALVLTLGVVLGCSSGTVDGPSSDPGTATVVAGSDHGAGPAIVTAYNGFRSPSLNNERSIWVYTPPGYDSSRTYPVLYMQDGSEVFATGSANPSATWRADLTATQLIANGTIAPIIIVAVGTPNRNVEYTPTADPQVAGSGGGPQYVQMLTRELKPFIDARYRTRTDAQSTAIGGGSYGGLIAAYAALHSPGTFGKADGTSASLWWANQLLTAQVGSLAGKLPVTFWLDRGVGEVSSDPNEVDRLGAFHDALVAKGWVDGVDVKYQQGFPGGHDVGSWAQRFGPMLQFLFPHSG